MKYIDFVVQAAFILIAAACVPLLYNDTSLPPAILYIQLCLGPWQVISALVCWVTQSAFGTQRKWYLIGLLSYFLLLTLLAVLHIQSMHYFFFGGAWALALYYCWISFHTAFDQTNKRSSFLPNISF